MPAAETIADAEALFERGPVHYFEGEKTVKVDLNDLAGDTEYNLYVAVRNINPLVYSDLASEVIDTHVPYTEMITLESVGLTSFSYHIMKPEGVTKYKHVCLSKSDYDYIVSLIGGSLHSYVSAFGAEATEDQTYNFDTTFFDIVDFRQDIYSDMEFIIIAGEVDENGQVAESAVKSLLFKTKKAGVAPYDFEVSVGNIGSMTADIAIEPEEGIERFRYLVASRADFDYTAFEGEASVRRMIIGHWDDLTNESTKAITVNATYAVAMTAGVFPKGSIDEVLGRPGNENLTAGDVIYNNGTQLTEQEVAAAMSEEGLVIESGELLPNTEYEFGVYAANAEGVGVSEIVEFTTLLPPQQGGELRAKLPGKYTATTKDSNGDPVTFSVTIATGVNEATEKAYSDLNRLVVLGFAPCGVDYASPEELLANGWAATEEEANANYGPKWFIEFNSDETISTSLPVNDELDYTMLNFDGKQYYFHAFAKRPTSDRYTDAVRSFPVEVSDDLTVTIKKLVEETDYGTFTYYPGVLSGTSQWWGDMVFAASEEIVLKRDADQGPEPAAVKSVRHLSMPERVTVNLGASPAVDNRRAVAERLMR